MDFTLQISSDWTNVINSILFEIVLITLIFFLTADVCARFNYLALADGSVQELVVMSPPLVGGGVISTNRKRSFIMIALRSLGIFLIFGTALTIDGGTTDVKVTKAKDVYSPAALLNDTSRANITELSNLRYTCTVNYNNSLVFGRLDVDGHCETDDGLLENAVSIHSKLERTSVSFSKGCRQETVPLFKKGDFSTEYLLTTCEEGGRKANTVCFHRRNRGVVDLSECVATFQLNASTFAVCELFRQILEGPSATIETDCHPAFNLGGLQDLWQTAVAIARNVAVIDMIAAVSVAGEERREIQEYVERDVTKVHSMWFLCLAVKLILLIVLGVLSIMLRSKGARRILNDDRALLGLLKQKLDDWIGLSNSNAQDPSTIYLHLQTNEEGERNVWASTMPNYNTVVSSPEPEA